jgi:hypothetical protein
LVDAAYLANAEKKKVVLEAGTILPLSHAAQRREVIELWV